MIKADRKGKASGLENLRPYHRMESMRRSNILSWLLFPDLPLSSHLRLTGHHDSFGKLKVTIIDHNTKWDDKSRQERESFWIRKLKTLSPNGIRPYHRMESMRRSNILSWLLFVLVVLWHTICSIGPKYIFHTVAGRFFLMSLGIIPFSTIFWQCYLIHLPIMSHFYIYFYF
jgi:hypothetical protein